jgi:hypothetical protein
LYAAIAGLMRTELADLQQTLVHLESTPSPAPDALHRVERQFTQLAGVFDLLGWQANRRSMEVHTGCAARLTQLDPDARRALLKDLLAGLLDIETGLGDGAAAASTSPRPAETLAGRMRGGVIARTRQELSALEELLKEGRTASAPGDSAALAARVSSIAGSLAVLEMPRAALVLDDCGRAIAAAGPVPDAGFMQVLTDSLAAVQEYLRAYAIDPVAADAGLAGAVPSPGRQPDHGPTPPALADVLEKQSLDDDTAVFEQLAAELIERVVALTGAWHSTPAGAFPAAPLVALLRRLSASADRVGHDDIRYLCQDVAMVVDAVAGGDRELSSNLYETIEYSLSTLTRKLASTQVAH